MMTYINYSISLVLVLLITVLASSLTDWKKVFLEIDQNGSGEVSKKELIAWTKRSEIEMVKNTIVEEFDLIDVNGDDQISFYEHMKGFEKYAEYAEAALIALEASYSGAVSEEEELRKTCITPYCKVIPTWKVADLNKDMTLSVDEYFIFGNPYAHEAMRDHETKQTMRMLDENIDGKITLTEFLALATGVEVEDVSEEEVESYIKGQHKHQQQLPDLMDTNNNGELDFAEIRAGTIKDEKRLHLEIAKRIINEVDANKDGFLSMEEFLTQAALDGFEGSLGNLNKDKQQLDVDDDDDEDDEDDEDAEEEDEEEDEEDGPVWFEPDDLDDYEATRAESDKKVDDHHQNPDHEEL